ncbi:unnamed protein product [Bursaphelenchus okinawaensis]|uniref:Integrator complex subunit 4/Protein SIEL C-terminal Ig-like domain-containing protein n=1 Tax=Bursaphelenchus okinawaensis TaxID=465554 RepID=A0A811LUB1_9BILA|nr:unnamed protein product [Bursaphelenchus okinawaensis]CAG9127860.1 unnamed protein product [Bursaphelenchus okinawaensis]
MSSRNIVILPPSLTSSFQFKSGSSKIIFAARETEKELELRLKCLDPDPRVRTDAMNELEAMCADGRMISVESYPLIAELSTNSAKSVRLSALRLVLILAERYPEYQVRNEKGFNIRLHDDAFVQVCHAVNDIETDVRAEAARLLGEFSCVSDSFLDQTLDKKVMKTMQYAYDDKNKMNTTKFRPSSGWSVGKKLGEDVPIEIDGEEKDAMIPMGACGAFVSGLEDEFMCVRQAAVFSLGRLAASRSDFARQSIDHLADMFNDEMQQIRLDAIKAMTPLIVHGTLDKEQLNTILSVLSDAIPDNRLALHSLLGMANFAEFSCVLQVLKALQDSMRRYPRDRNSIFRCLSQIGRRHAILVQPLVPDLLNLHPIFDAHEQDVNDDFYLCNLILTLNAAHIQPQICSIIPEYIIKHYRYLRHSNLDLIPQIATFERKRDTKAIFDTSTTKKRACQDSIIKHLHMIYCRMFEACAHPLFEDKMQLLKLILRQYDEERVMDVIEESLALISQLKVLFLGVDKRIKAFLTEMEFQLRLLHMFRRVGLNQNDDWSGINELIVNMINNVQTQVTELEVDPSQQNQSICSWLHELAQTHHDTARSTSKSLKKMALMPLLSASTSKALDEISKNLVGLPKMSFDLGRLKRKSCTNLEFWHAGTWLNSESGTLRFVAGIPAGLDVYSTVFNIDDEDKKNFRVEVRYPDKRRYYHKPKPSDFIEVADREFRFQSTVFIISDEAWAVQSDIRLACGILLDSEMTGFASDSEDHKAFVPLMNYKQSSKEQYAELRIFPMTRC